MFIQIFLQQEFFLYQRILNLVKDGLLLFVNTDAMIRLKNWLRGTTRLTMMSLASLPTRGSSFMHLKILIVGKINIVGSAGKQTLLRKHFSHLLFLSTSNLFTGCNRFLLLTATGLPFMD